MLTINVGMLTLRGGGYTFWFLKYEKSSYCLETNYISYVTSKIVRKNSLNQETNKKCQIYDTNVGEKCSDVKKSCRQTRGFENISLQNEKE